MPTTDHKGFGVTPAAGVAIASPRFRVDAVLGRGGMGVVYRARDTHLNRDVALKVLLAHPDEADQALARALREARNASRLVHPNIVRIYDAGVDPAGHPYIAMELIDGVPLSRVAKPCATPLALHLAAQAADALAEAHASGIVHRDIKPANMMVLPATTEIRLMVLDFGVARDLNRNEPPTRDGYFVGTARYASPEQTLSDPVTAAADVYSLGCVFYELLTGRAPFEHNTEAGLLYRHAHTEPRDPRIYRPELEPEVADLVIRCLRKDPAERPSASALRGDLRALLAGRNPGVLELAEGKTGPSPAVEPSPNSTRNAGLDEVAQAESIELGGSCDTAAAPRRFGHSMFPPLRSPVSLDRRWSSLTATAAGLGIAAIAYFGVQATASPSSTSENTPPLLAARPAPEPATVPAMSTDAAIQTSIDHQMIAAANGGVVATFVAAQAISVAAVSQARAGEIATQTAPTESRSRMLAGEPATNEPVGNVGAPHEPVPGLPDNADIEFAMAASAVSEIDVAINQLAETIAARDAAEPQADLRSSVRGWLER